MSFDNDLATYLSEISRYPLLDAATEKELGRQLRAGDLAAGRKLVTANLRFVVRVAREYRGYGLRLADLVQEGNLGLMKAVEKFDPSRDIRLISYAVWWIRAYMQSFILRSWSLVKVGTTQVQRRLFFSLAKAKRKMEGGGEAKSDDRETLAKELRVKTSDIVDMEQRLSGRDVSFDAPLDIDGPSRVEAAPSNEPLADEQVAASEIKVQLSESVKTAMARLDQRERFIVQHRLLDDSPLTFKDLGDTFGVSRERARQLEIRAMQKLRRLLMPDLERMDMPLAA